MAFGEMRTRKVPKHLVILEIPAAGDDQLSGTQPGLFIALLTCIMPVLGTNYAVTA